MAKIISFEERRKMREKRKAQRARRQKTRQESHLGGNPVDGQAMEPEKMERLKAAFSELMTFAQEQGGDAMPLAMPGQIHIEDRPTSIKFSFPVAGFSKEEVQVSVLENVLLLKLFKLPQKKEVIDPKKIDRVSEPYMTQTIPLPQKIEASESSAHLKGEQLEVVLKKKAFIKNEPIVIEVKES